LLSLSSTSATGFLDFLVSKFGVFLFPPQKKGHRRSQRESAGANSRESSRPDLRQATATYILKNTKRTANTFLDGRRVFEVDSAIAAQAVYFQTIVTI